MKRHDLHVSWREGLVRDVRRGLPIFVVLFAIALLVGLQVFKYEFVNDLPQQWWFVTLFVGGVLVIGFVVKVGLDRYLQNSGYIGDSNVERGSHNPHFAKRHRTKARRPGHRHDERHRR